MRVAPTAQQPPMFTQPVAEELPDTAWSSSVSEADHEVTGGDWDCEHNTIISSRLYRESAAQIQNDDLAKANEPNDVERKNSPPSIESIFHEVMMTLFGQSKDFFQFQQKLISGEKAWKETLYQEAEKTHRDLNAIHAIQGATSSIKMFLGTLMLCATGASSIFSGGDPLFSVGAAALGGLLALDSLLDDAGKKAIASLLAQGNGESKATWLGRIYAFSSLASLAAGFGVAPNRAISIATNVTNVSASCVGAGAEMRREAVEALLLEIEHKTQRSDLMLETHIDAVKKISEEVKNTLVSVLKTYEAIRTATSVVFS